jgi:hypothetical protein
MIQDNDDTGHMIQETDDTGQNFASQRDPPGPLHAQSQGDGGQLLDGVEPQLDVLVPQLIYEDGYGVQRVVPRVVRHGSAARNCLQLISLFRQQGGGKNCRDQIFLAIRF